MGAEFIFVHKRAVPGSPALMHCVPSAAIKVTKEALEGMNSSVQSLRQGSQDLHNSLTSVKNDIQGALGGDECRAGPAVQTCNDIRASLDQLEGTPGLDQVSSTRQLGWRAVTPSPGSFVGTSVNYCGTRAKNITEPLHRSLC